MSRAPRLTAWWLVGVTIGMLSARGVVADESTPAPSRVLTSVRQPISANFREVDFESAMQFLAESAGVNIVISPKAKDMSKPVTLRLVDIPLQRALEYVVKGQGLAYRFDESAIFVATLDEMEAEPLETKVYQLNQGPGLFASFDPISDTRQSVALQSTGVRKMTTLKDVLGQVVPEVRGSSIMLDERTGSLIVTHVPYYLEQIERLLVNLDVLPLEVRIEARFIEVTLTDTDEWNLGGQLTGDVALTKKMDNKGTLGPGLELASGGPTFRRGTKVDFTNFARQTSGDGLNLTFQGVLSGTQYQSLLHALAENKKTKTLSAPQVTTMNNQTAAIKVVTEYVYASRYEASVKREDLNGDGKFDGVVNGVRETRFVNVPQDFVTKDLGILLNVTPSVGHDMKTIILALKPEVTEKKTDDTFGGEITLPRFTSRYLTTSVVVEDGETVVLGGLMKDTLSNTITKVPVLGSLPVIGKAFQKKSDSTERSNLLIFVTAHVIQPAGQSALARHEAN